MACDARTRKPRIRKASSAAWGWGERAPASEEDQLDPELHPGEIYFAGVPRGAADFNLTFEQWGYWKARDGSPPGALIRS